MSQMCHQRNYPREFFSSDRTVQIAFGWFFTSYRTDGNKKSGCSSTPLISSAGLAIDYLQPRLHSLGEAPVQNLIDRRKLQRSHLTKREIAEMAIRNAIETGLYQPGQVISQRQIGENLGLSVTPIREAIIELCSTGIVARHSHQSIKVTEIDPQRLRDIFHVRRLLEEEAIGLCVRFVDEDFIHRLREINRRIESLVDTPDRNTVNALDREFHKTVFAACRNEALVWAIDQVKSSFPMYALWGEPGRLAISVDEHNILIGALERRDVEGSILAQRAHLARGLDETIAYLKRVKGTATL